MTADDASGSDRWRPKPPRGTETVTETPPSRACGSSRREERPQYDERMTTVRRREVFSVVVIAVLAVIGGILGVVLPEPQRPVTEAALPTEWLARILLILAIAWIVIGAVATHTRLVGRPGAAAARATWLSSTRPWRARESTLGLLPLDRWLIFLVPVALLVATRILQTAATSPVHLLLVVGAWVVFALVLRLVVGRRSPWPVIAAVGGVVVLRCILSLIALSFTGADGFSRAFWSTPALRIAFVAVAFALFVWAFVAAAWALQIQSSIRFAVGALLAAIGAGVAVPAAVVAAAGAERVVGAWDDGLGLLPGGAVFLVPGQAPSLDVLAGIAVIAGVVLALIGAALVLAHKRSPRA
jgi:hypothetical protein